MQAESEEKEKLTKPTVEDVDGRPQEAKEDLGANEEEGQGRLRTAAGVESPAKKEEETMEVAKGKEVDDGKTRSARKKLEPASPG